MGTSTATVERAFIMELWSLIIAILDEMGKSYLTWWVKSQYIAPPKTIKLASGAALPLDALL
jgi:hypothetical protein